MKVTPCTTQEDFVDPFPQDPESLFLEEHIVFTEFAIEDTRALVEDVSRQLSCLSESDRISEVYNACNDRRIQADFYLSIIRQLDCLSALSVNPFVFLA